MRSSILAFFLISLTLSFVHIDQADAACACNDMTVTWADPSQKEIVCTNNVMPGFAECTKRTGGSRQVCTSTVEYACPVGLNGTHLVNTRKLGFRIQTTNGAGSTAADCTTGQVLQYTINTANPVVKNNINPTSVDGAQTFGTFAITVDNSAANTFADVGNANPFGGDNFVRDANDVIIFNTNAGAQWYDNVVMARDNDSELVDWQYRFISFVRGSAGQNSCSCSFDIALDWTNPANATAAFTQRNTAAQGSENCTFNILP